MRGRGVIGIGETPYDPYPGAQFPVSSFDQYVAQMVPNTETTIDQQCQTTGDGCSVTVNGIAALLDKIGPAILMGHSQGGTIAMRVAAVKPELVKAVVPVEPASGCVIEDYDLPNFSDIGFLPVFGDHPFSQTAPADPSSVNKKITKNLYSLTCDR